jgi:hypothetical protein
MTAWICSFHLYDFVHAKESLKGQCQKIHKINYLSSFLKYFHRNNSIYQITTPSNRVKEEICRRMPRNFFSSNPISAKAKKLGLLSIYKFSLFLMFLVLLGILRLRCPYCLLRLLLLSSPLLPAFLLLMASFLLPATLPIKCPNLEIQFSRKQARNWVYKFGH